MGKVLMLYASMTGNTELMAEIIAEVVENRGHEVVTKTFDLDSIDVEELLEYDGVLVGTYSWDDGELPYEAEDFYEELDDVDITGKIVGVFGSGDSFYDSYGGASQMMGERFKEKQANLVAERLIVDLEPDKQDVVRCQQFAEAFCGMIEE
ncbi:flavodoxin I [Virgibacillus subterraneus]|uniref:Flavodoxin n=1 Tax=Virgibacillus subterraneus TaxID=621109 RepID=A0A1H9BHI9_9BACI|nr:flavodoxin [Virgibacillus subterraneus]SEP88365.1 flavodoxin I [Virgibacillus subterraneus]